MLLLLLKCRWPCELEQRCSHGSLRLLELVVGCFRDSFCFGELLGKLERHFLGLLARALSFNDSTAQFCTR